jgi:hypothetical protein
MFNGEFKMGGRPESKAKGFYIKLWRHGKESKEYTTEFFKKSIENDEMGWSGLNQELLYRDKDGKLWKAKFEETDG